MEQEALAPALIQGMQVLYLLALLAQKYKYWRSSTPSSIWCTFPQSQTTRFSKDKQTNKQTNKQITKNLGRLFAIKKRKMRAAASVFVLLY
jgi:hypothetical protein